MDQLVETLHIAAMAVVTWGNLGLGVWCIVLGRQRGLVIGLLLAWVLLSTVLFVFGFVFFGHDFRPPAYVNWVGWIWIVLGVGLFGYLCRVLLPDGTNSSNRRHG